MSQAKKPAMCAPADIAAVYPVRIAVIGCGYWGTNYVRVFREMPEARIVAICEQRKERIMELRDRLMGVRPYASLDDLFASEKFDAAVVCTEATSHYAIARRCLQAGKHVLVEKPITTSANEAADLTMFAEADSRILMVGHTFLYNAGIRKVKEYIDVDPHRVYYLYACRTNLGPIRRDVNALWDLGTHDVAIFNYLLGRRPEWVSGVGGRVLRNGREDVGFVALGYPDGVVGHIHVSWADPNKAREVVVICSDKRIVFNDLNGLEPVRVFEKGVSSLPVEAASFGEYQSQIRDGDILRPKIEAKEPLKEQCRHFLHCIATQSQPLTSGWDGYNVLCVMEAVDRSIQSKGAQVEVISDARIAARAA